MIVTQNGEIDIPISMAPAVEPAMTDLKGLGFVFSSFEAVAIVADLLGTGAQKKKVNVGEERVCGRGGGRTIISSLYKLHVR